MQFTPKNLNQTPIFGIAGNFAGHLSQAGESEHFNQMSAEKEDAPQGIFPIYLPYSTQFLGINPLSSTQILANFSTPIHLQMEAEVCILCNITYQNKQMTHLTPLAFSAFNDCSIRQKGTQKLSTKKNWGPCSAGMSQTWHTLDDFSEQGTFKNQHLISFLKRNGQVIQYGEDSPVQSYQYFNQKLIDWLISTFNHQSNEGIMENLHQAIEDNLEPSQIIISLGATRYTPFGETGFLQPEDKIGIFIYDTLAIQPETIEKAFNHLKPNQTLPSTLCLIQNIKSL